MLDGSANGFSEVEIDVFADSAKDVEIFLLNESLDYEHREIRRPGPESPEAILSFDWDEVPVKLCVFGVDLLAYGLLELDDGCATWSVCKDGRTCPR